MIVPCLSARNRLIFLIPASFRGAVVLLQDRSAGQPLPRAAGYITLRVPANGLLTTSDELEGDWLTEADYYFIDAAGQRLGELPQLSPPDAEPNAQPGKAGQQVGVFPASLAHKRLYTGLAGSYPGLPASYLS